MKWTYRLVLLLLVLSAVSDAQQPAFVQSQTFTGNVAPGPQAVLLENSYVTNHVLSWTVTGTVSACSVQLETSALPTSGFSIVGVAQTCTSSGTYYVSGGANTWARFNVTALTATGTVSITYLTNSPGTINGIIQNTQVAVGTALGTIGSDGNLIWDTVLKQLKVQGSAGAVSLYNPTNALNSTWSTQFVGPQANGNKATYGEIQETLVDNTNGAVSGSIDIFTRNAGVAVDAVSISKDGTTVVPALGLTTTTVSTLPAAAAGNKGQMRSVSDSTAVAAEGQTCVGSSTNAALAFSNGTVWKCF